MQIGFHSRDSHFLVDFIIVKFAIKVNRKRKNIKTISLVHVLFMNLCYIEKYCEKVLPLKTKGQEIMIYEEYMKATLEDFGKNGNMTERGILRVLENIACYHSDSLGCGAADREKTGIAWILLEWKVKILRSPRYGEKLRVTTWSRGVATFCTTLRDYEIYGENGELCVIASSKWAFVDLKLGKISKIEESTIAHYQGEDKSVFGEKDLIRLREPKTYSSETEYRIRRTDIDLNSHVHNLCYLDFAMECLPEDIYQTESFHEIRISYRKEIVSGEQITCKYCEDNGKQIVGIYGGGTLRALVELK